MEKEILEMNKAEELYLNAKETLRTAIINYLTSILESREGKKLYFRDIDEDYGCCYGNPTITYDGGNHPEYASNAFSEVHGLYLYEDGSLCFDIEDSDCYGVERVWSVDELIDIKGLVDYLLEVEKDSVEE